MGFDTLKCFFNNVEPILVSGSIICSIILFVLNYWISYKFEEAYEIPKEYYSSNVIVILFKGIIMSFLGLFNYYMVLAYKEMNFIELYTIVFFSLMLLIIMYTNSFNKLSLWLDNKKNSIKAIGFSLIFPIVLLVFRSFCNKLFIIKVYVILFFILVIYNYIISAIIFTDFKRKWIYEVVENNNNEFIVLSHYKNQLLCVDYNTKETDTGICLDLLTKNYYLISNDIIKIRIKNFKKSKKFELKVNGVPTK